MIGDFNSQSQSWGYNTIYQRGETIEDWPDEHIPLARKKEVRAEERDRTKTGAHDIMHNVIAMPEMTKSIKKLKKKSPGPDNITNEMLQHLGNSALGTLEHIQS